MLMDCSDGCSWIVDDFQHNLNLHVHPAAEKMGFRGQGTVPE